MPSGNDVSYLDITQETYVEVKVPEHRIMLSFTSDKLAEAYSDWFYSKGREAFLKWVNTKKNRSKYA